MGHRFLGFKEQNKKMIIKTDKGSFESDTIVGADGPRSPVAKAAGIYADRGFLQGLQARVYYKGEPGVSEVRLGFGEFAWVVPENEKIARIGVIGTSNLGADYKKLIGDHKIIENQHGTLPLYNPKQKLQRGNVSLIGDAATQVKATTYGGVIYGLLAGKLLAEDPENYEKNFNKKLGKDLWLSLQMRETMNNMSEKECNELIEVFRKHDTRKILEKYDRDFPSKFIVQLLLKEKSLWKLSFSALAKKFFKKE